MPRAHPEDVYLEAWEIAQAGKTYLEAAQAVGISRAALVAWAHRTGRTKSRGCASKVGPCKRAKFAAMVRAGASQSEIERQLGISNGTLRKLLVIEGVEDLTAWPKWPKFDPHEAAEIYDGGKVMTLESVAAELSRRYGVRIDRDNVAARLATIGIKGRTGGPMRGEPRSDHEAEDRRMREQTLREIAELDRRRALQGGVPWSW